jgi:hypothetical protein
MADSSDGWDLTGIPKKFWPYVREVLVARELYRLATLVSDRGVSASLHSTAESLLANSAAKLAKADSKV